VLIKHNGVRTNGKVVLVMTSACGELTLLLLPTQWHCH